MDSLKKITEGMHQVSYLNEYTDELIKVFAELTKMWDNTAKDETK